MLQGLEHKVALVTGGGSGIGRAVSLAFARERTKVVIADIDVEGGTQTAARITDNGGEALFLKTDVSREAEVQALVNQAVAVFGGLDCAFNGAGIEAREATVVNVKEADWDRILAINLKGIWLCMKYEIPPMLKLGKGAIVNASSAAGLVGSANISPYVASKHGVVGLTKSAALEFAEAGVRINAICPYTTLTPMLKRILGEGRQPVPGPIGRIGTPEEVAETVVWLCSDASSLVTGHALAVDGGHVAR